MPFITPTKTSDSAFKWVVAGCHHPEAADAVHGQYSFCGCGAPEITCKYIAAELEALKNIEFLPEGDPGRLFLRYWLASVGLSEHGGSVYGGWLTDDGERLLAFIRENIP